MLVSRLDRRFYPNIESGWDDEAFRDYILERLKPDHTLLDLGAGAGIVKAMNFRGLCAKVCGLDPDPRIVDNPFLDEAKIGLGDEIPWPDATFDMVVADNVLEHLADPEVVFKEISRILKPGGLFLFKTPNRRHYMPMIARYTPLAFHRFYNKIRGRASEDTFPTLYRANRPKDIEAAALSASLEPVRFKLLESRPEYLRLNALTYLGGLAYERLVNATDRLADLRILLIGELKKAPSDTR